MSQQSGYCLYSLRSQGGKQIRQFVYGEDFINCKYLLFDSSENCFDTVMCIQLDARLMYYGLNLIGGCKETLADLIVGQSSGDQDESSSLPFGQYSIFPSHR